MRRLTIVATVILLVYWGILFFLTHTPDLAHARLFPHSDKVAHFSAYALLAWMTAMVLRIFAVTPGRVCVIVLVVCASYGAIDEWLQQFTRRQSDLNDWLADVLGVMVGLLIFVMTHRGVRRLYHRMVGKRDTEGQESL